MRIKELIKEKGLTVAEVAQRMNVKAPSLSNVINGNPTVEMLVRIAKALEVDIRELFGGENEELYGLVQYKGQCYKIDSTESLKRLLSIIETDEMM
jgi:transcriptional regulator with XRE-family HTH domain